MIDIQLPKAQIDAALRIMDPRQFRAAVKSAVGKTTREGRVMLREEVRKSLNLKVSNINEVLQNFTRDVGGVPQGTIRVSHKRLALIDFKYTRASKTKGVFAKPYVQKSAFRLRHAFRARMRSGHIGVWQRARALGPKGWNLTTPKGRRRKWRQLTESGYAARLPIDEVKVPSVWKHVQVPKVTRVILGSLGEIMVKNFMGQYSRFGLKPI